MSGSGAEPSSRVEVFELAGPAEVRSCLEIQRLAWGMTDTELVPLSQLLAAQRAGGFLAGARMDGTPVGFSYGFPAYRQEIEPSHGLHSHMTAVLPAARGHGVGSALKWFQRKWCLERGIHWIEWTFDPLRAGNARFNIERLGATASEYLTDAYGAMADSLNAGLASDRLVACWDLAASPVAALELREEKRPRPQNGRAALASLDNGMPTRPQLDLNEDTLRVAVPSSVSRLLASEPKKAVAWRHAVRDTLAHYLEAGYTVTRFLDNSYHLQALVGLEQQE